MSPLLLGTMALLVMVFMCLAGVPIFVSLGSVGILGLIIVSGLDRTLGIISSLPFTIFASYSLAIVPLFFLMGDIASLGGVAAEGYKAAYKLLGRTRGGLAMATTVGSGLSAACMGSSAANAALFSRIALPEMLKLGYERSFSLGCIASVGTFAVMIPPSLGFVLYGIVTQESIGKLLMAGVFPGILTVGVYLVGILLMCRSNPKLAPVSEIKYTTREKLKAMLGLWGILLLFLLVMGGIYAGLFPPSAGAAVGASGAFIIALSRRKLTLPALINLGIDTMRAISSFTVILLGGFLLARFLVMSGFTQALVALVSTGLSKGVVLMGIVLMYLILGCLMDPVSMLITTVPFIYPLIISLGFDGIWFGVIFTKLSEIGVLTPPVGMNLFVVAAAAGKGTTVADVIKGVGPFLIMEAFVMVILILFPGIALFLPSTMYGQ
jgi:C4-dicarboxylate transporter DctM subunit